MAWVKDLVLVKEELDEGSDEVVHMVEMWTEVLADLQPRYQLWNQRFETFTGKKMPIIHENSSVEV